MKVKVIHEFKDAEYDLVLRTVGEELEVPDERGSYEASERAGRSGTGYLQRLPGPD